MRDLARRWLPWPLAFSGLVATGWAALRPIAIAPQAPAATQRAAQGNGGSTFYRADSLAEAVAGSNPFSPLRRAPSVPYDPARGDAPPVSVPAKPTLVLRGLVWGRYPAAILEGLPGLDGPHVLRIGDTLSGLTLTRIDSVHAIIAGIDTVWTLRVRNPWQ